MTTLSHAWLSAGRGAAPRAAWAFSTDAPLRAVAVAREFARTLVGDASGGVYRLDRDGKVEHLTRGLAGLTALAAADNGAAAAAVFGEGAVAWLEPDLSVKWTLDLPDPVLAVDLDPHGRHAALSLANGTVLVYTNRRRRIARFPVLRPLAHLRFVATERRLVGAAEHALWAAYDLRGNVEVDVKTWANCGDLAVTGDGSEVALAAFNLGLQRYDADGSVRDTLVVDGSPSRVAVPFRRGPVACATLERELHLFDRTGDVLWSAPAPDDVTALRFDALGRELTVGLAGGRVLRLRFA